MIPLRPSVAAVPGLGFAALLIAGGVLVHRDPVLRPPRLPRRRPPAWGLPALGAAAGCATLAGWRTLAAGRAGAPARALAAAALAAAATPGTLAPVLEAHRRTRARRRPPAPGAVVVLGCALRGGAPSELLRLRLELAARILAGAPGSPQVVVTGGRGPDEPVPEAAVMARWLAARGIGPVTVEDAATSTAENLDLAAPLLRRAPVVVVTSDFHVPRVRAGLRRRGLPWAVAGAPTPARYWATSLLREFAALGAGRPWAPAAVAAGWAWWLRPRGSAGGGGGGVAPVPGAPIE